MTGKKLPISDSPGPTGPTQADSGRGGGKGAGRPAARDRQDESAIEAFSEEGAGIAAKE